MKILNMKKEHIQGILEVERSSFTLPWSEKAFEEELCNVNATYLCAVENTNVIGYIGMWLILDEGQITNLAVHPKFRRNSVGSCLLEALLNNAKEKDIKFLTLEVRKSNQAAISLYRSFGFEFVGIRKKYYADNQEDAALMNLYLDKT